MRQFPQKVDFISRVGEDLLYFDCDNLNSFKRRLRFCLLLFLVDFNFTNEELIGKT